MGTHRSRNRARRHVHHVGKVLAAAGVVVGVALTSPAPTGAGDPEAAVEPPPSASVASEVPRDAPMPRTDGDVTPLAVAIVGLTGYAVVDLAPRPRRRPSG
jgi:hypothetical protein